MPDDSQRPILGMLMNPKTADLILNTVLGAECNPTIEAALRAKPDLHQLLRYAAEGFNYLVDAAEQAGIAAYYFVLRDVDPEQRTIDAWVRELGQWARRPVQWPDVFYDQSKQVGMGRETHALHALYATSIPINSVRTLGKWSCHNLLSQSEDVRPLLPETIFYQRPDDLLSMLKRHRNVYVKPEWGSNGRGISRIWTTDQGSWGWQESIRGRTLETGSLNELVALVKQAAGNTPVIIQQEIALHEHAGHRSDMRVGMRKDGLGQWQPDRGCVRVAQSGAIATNWWRGGSSIPFPDGIQVYADGAMTADGLWEAIWAAALKIARRLEEAVGPMGELGLDMAFDHDLCLWLIEVNPMPNKGTYPTIDGVIDSQYTHTVGYAVYLYEHRHERDLALTRR